MSALFWLSIVLLVVSYLWALFRSAEDGCPEGLPVLAAHEVVEDGVEGGGQEVEAARDVHQVLVKRPVPVVICSQTAVLCSSVQCSKVQ